MEKVLKFGICWDNEAKRHFWHLAGLKTNLCCSHISCPFHLFSLGNVSCFCHSVGLTVESLSFVFFELAPGALSLKHTRPTVGRLKRFGETRTSSGTNLFSVFSCVGSFWDRVDSVCSDSTCEVWEGWLSAVWAIGYSDWLCASKSAQCGRSGMPCAHCFSSLHFPFSCVGVLARD